MYYSQWNTALGRIHDVLQLLKYVQSSTKMANFQNCSVIQVTIYNQLYILQLFTTLDYTSCPGRLVQCPWNFIVVFGIGNECPLALKRILHCLKYCSFVDSRSDWEICRKPLVQISHCNTFNNSLVRLHMYDYNCSPAAPFVSKNFSLMLSNHFIPTAIYIPFSH